MEPSAYPPSQLSPRRLDHLFRVLARREQSLRLLVTDRASFECEHELRSQRGPDELDRIRAARARFASGCYGLCFDCSMPIGYERLQEQPHAECCEACEARRSKSLAAP